MKKIGLAALLLPIAMVAAACSSGADSATAPAGDSAAPAASSAATAGGDGSPLVIGFAAGLTGDCAIGDVSGAAGLEYGVKVLNENGGVAGHPVQLITKDMKGDSALGGTVAQELIDQGAQVLVAPCFPGMAAGVIQAGGKAGIPVISAASTQPEFTVVGGSPAFIAAFGDNVQAAAAAEYALKEGAKTSFTVSSPDLTYTQNTPKWFTEVFEAGGGKNLGDVSFNLGQTDFSAQVTQIANLPEQPDVIFTAMFPPDTSSFVRALRSAGVTSQLVGADGNDTVALLEAGADAVNGTVFTTHGFDQAGTPFGDFLAGMTKANGKAPEAPALAGLGYTTAQIIAAAVEQAGSTDPAAIQAAMGNLENLQTATGVITFKGTNGVPSKTVYIGGVEDGKFVLKDSFVPANIPTP